MVTLCNAGDGMIGAAGFKRQFRGADPTLATEVDRDSERFAGAQECSIGWIVVGHYVTCIRRRAERRGEDDPFIIEQLFAPDEATPLRHSDEFEPSLG